MRENHPTKPVQDSPTEIPPVAISQKEISEPWQFMIRLIATQMAKEWSKEQSRKPAPEKAN